MADAPAGTSPVPTWIWLLLVAAGAVACFTDIRSMRIPNWLTLPLLVAGLAHGFLDGGPTGLLHSVAGSAIAGFVFVIGYLAFGGGAGDAKIMLAFGSWVGIEASMLLMLSVTIVGFCQALVVVVLRGSVADVPMALFDGWIKVYMTAKGALRGRIPNRALDAAAIEAQPQARHKGWFPYAPAIFLGTVGAWWYSVKFGGAPS